METFQVDAAFQCSWVHRDFADMRLSVELGDAEEMFYGMVCREFDFDGDSPSVWID
jgi:hypothetical protein